MRYHWHQSFEVFIFGHVGFKHSFLVVVLQKDGFCCRLYYITLSQWMHRQWPVRPLTLAKVWSASWSRTKTKVAHVNVCAPSGRQAAAHSYASCWQSLTLIQTGFPRGESPPVRRYICDRWPSSLRFSHLLLAHIWGGAASESVAFLICQAKAVVLWFLSHINFIYIFIKNNK